MMKKDIRITRLLLEFENLNFPFDPSQVQRVERRVTLEEDEEARDTPENEKQPGTPPEVGRVVNKVVQSMK